MEGWGLLPGRPLGLVSTIALAAVCWVWFARRSLPLGPLLAVALAAKVGLGLTLLAPRGFEARYYANAEFAGEPERGTESAGRGFTRIDDRLDFDPDRGPDLPIAYLNDFTRFNFYLPTQPDRAKLPVSARWQGWLHVRHPATERFYVRASGAQVAVAVGGDFSATMPPRTTEWIGDVSLPAGVHRIAVSAAFPTGVPRRLEVGRLVHGRAAPLDGGDVFRRQSPAGAIDRVMRFCSTMLDVLVCAALAWLTGSTVGRAWRALRDRFVVHDALALAWVAVVVDALLFARPILHRMVILSGGDDWLTYETLAREIGLHGPWMAEGAELGHGRPFYYQPLYPYFVAACHWLFGEGLFGVYFVQRLLAGATVIALWRTTAALWTEAVGAAGLVAATVLVYEKFAVWSGVLLTEVLFVPLVCLWTLLLVRLALDRAPAGRRALAVGIVGGVATLARSTLVLAWPVAALAAGIRRGRRAWLAVALVLVSMLAVTSLATVRNWIVAHEFVPIATSGSVNLYLGNEPRAKLITAPARKAAYDRLGLDPYTQMAVEYARQEPRAFLHGLRQKALYTLGWFETLLPGTGTSRFYIATWIIALVGMALAAIGRLPASWAAFIPLLLAAAHFAVVVVIFPHVYGDRLILPFYLLLVPYVAVASAAMYRATAPVGASAVGAALWFGGCGAAVWHVTGGLAGLDLPMIVVAVLLSGVCVFGLPEVSAGQWPMAAYGVVLFVWAFRAGSAGAVSALRAEWLFLIAAVVSSVVVTNARVRRLIAVATCGVAALFVASRLPIAFEQLLKTHSASFADVAVMGSLLVGGALAVLAWLTRGRTDHGAIPWLAGCALMLAVLGWLTPGVSLDHLQLPGNPLIARRSRVGPIGALFYAAIWLRACRPITANHTVAVRLLQAALFGVFVAELVGVDLHRPGGAVLIAIGFVLGAVESARLPVARRETVLAA